MKPTETMRPDDLPTPKGLNLVWRRVGIEGIRPLRSPCGNLGIGSHKNSFWRRSGCGGVVSSVWAGHLDRLFALHLGVSPRAFPRPAFFGAVLYATFGSN